MQCATPSGLRRSGRGPLRWSVCPSRAIVASLLLACGHAGDRTSIRLYDGQTLGSRLRGVDSAVVLLWDPADCTSCGLLVNRWLEVRRQLPANVLLVLTRLPSEYERRDLVIHRIRPDGIGGDKDAAKYRQAMGVPWIGGREMTPLELQKLSSFLRTFELRVLASVRDKSVH